MRFSEKLILLRKRKGMTQQEFAVAVGVSRQSVYKWESGQSYPEAEKLMEIRRLYGVSIDHLLDESISFPFPSHAESASFIEIKKEVLTTPPSVSTEKKEPVASLDASESLTPAEPEPRVTQTKRIEVHRPVSTVVSVRKKKKMPSTLKEIVSTFFGKRR